MPHHSREKDVEDVAVEDVAVEDDVAAEAEWWYSDLVWAVLVDWNIDEEADYDC